MINDEEYVDLPEDKELAFLHLEKEFRTKLEENLEHSENNNSYVYYYREYVSMVMAAATELDIDYFDGTDWSITDRNSWDDYKSFALAVAQYRTQVRIRHSRRTKGYSVALDHATKEKIRHHLTQLKELASKLEVPETKRDAIFAKILTLEKELERE